jgi:hypothetical protein
MRVLTDKELYDLARDRPQIKAERANGNIWIVYDRWTSGIRYEKKSRYEAETKIEAIEQFLLTGWAK